MLRCVSEAPEQPYHVETPAPEVSPAAIPGRETTAPSKIALELPPDSGLVLIETVHKDVVEEPASSMTAAGASAKRPPRTRPARAAAPDEPLQMVETRKGESPPTTP